MAGPLTWREVSAPNFSGVAESQRAAAAALNNSFSGLSDALGKFGARRDDANTAAIAAEALRYTDPAAYDAALKAGTFTTGRPVTPEALDFLASRQASLLDNQNQGMVNDQLGWNNERTRTFEAARPAAVARINEIRSLASLGTPEGKAQAQELMRKSSDVLAAAGFTPDDVMNTINGNVNTANIGLASNDAFQKAGDANVDRAKRLEADKLFADTLQVAAGPEDLARRLRANTTADPDVISMALAKGAGEQGVALFGPGTTLEDLSIDQSIAGGRGTGAGLIGLVDRTEGGGRYDTLFGHSQRNGGAFAGVDVTKMTLDQLSQFDQQYGPWVKSELAKSGQDARIATPVGRFQIVGDTRRQVAQEMGLPGNTLFTPEVQNAMFHHLVDKRISGPKTMQGKIAGLRAEWEGFKSVPDEQLAQAITAYESGDRSALTGAAPSVTAPDPGQAAEQAIQRALQVSADSTSAADTQSLITAGNFIDEMGQTLIDQGITDEAFNTASSLLASLESSPDGTSEAEIVKKLHAEVGDEDGLPLDDLTDQMNRVTSKFGIAPHIAAALMKNGLEQTTWGTRWLFGDRHLDQDAMDQYFSQFIDVNAKTASGRIQPAIEQLRAIRAKRDGTAKIEQVLSQLEQAEQAYARAKERQAQGRNVDVSRPLERYQELLNRAQQTIDKIDANGLMRANTSSLTGR